MSIVVPFGRGEFVFTTSCTTALFPTSSVPLSVHWTSPVFPAPGSVIMPVAPLTKLAETNVVFAGTVSVITTLCAFILPVFETVIWYVMLSPACTGSVKSFLSIVSTGAECTVTSFVAVTPCWSSAQTTFASLCTTVLLSVGTSTFTISSTANSSLGASAPLNVHFTVPVPPWLGASIVPLFDMKRAETNVVCAGITSVITTVVASALPVFPAVIVYTMLSPASTVDCEDAFVRVSVGAEPTVVCAVACWVFVWSESIVTAFVITVPFGVGDLI